jgi:hypothetical protein
MDFKPKKRFPKKELNYWLRRNFTWDHNKWNELLTDLEQQGFKWVGNAAGRDALGLYLETNRQPA